jgi:inorganic triphosphatase YgiF
MVGAVREVELKLEFDPSHAARIKRHLSRQSRSAKRARQTLVSVYFDTPDLRLRHNRMSLRVRRVGAKHTQTIKNSDRHQAGLFDRAEWEQAIAGPLPDLAAAKHTGLEPLLNGDAASLRPAFETRIARSQYHLTSHGSRIEVSLDQGEIDTGERRAPVCELELELAYGQPAELFRVARDLGEVVPLRLSVRSKSDRGYELVGNSAGAIEKAADAHLGAAMTAAEAFRMVAYNCLRQLLANEPAMVGGDGEALHQMRIALRRLRAAITTFSSVVEDSQCERIKGKLKWIARELSPARDLDILVAEVLTPLRQQHPEEPGIAGLCRDFRRRRARAYRTAVAAVRSQRFRTLVLEVAEWIETGPWSQDDDDLLALRRAQPITVLAAQELARRRKKMKKRAQSLKELSAAERHALRIRAKKLRYAVEFFADVFPGNKNAKRCQAALSSLKDLQDSLGALNDIATREKLASRIAHSLPQASRRGASRERAFAAGVIVGSQEAHIQGLLDKSECAATEFLKIKPFWKGPCLQ